MEWRRLDDAELSFAAVYFCDMDESREEIFKFAAIFQRCSGVIWWKDNDGTTVLLIFDTAIPVRDCACFFPEQVDVPIYAPVSDFLVSPTGCLLFDMENKYTLNNSEFQTYFLF